eukprot:Awhi_evm1s13322
MSDDPNSGLDNSNIFSEKIQSLKNQGDVEGLQTLLLETYNDDDSTDEIVMRIA